MSYVEWFLRALVLVPVTLLPIINPLSTAPVLLFLTGPLQYIPSVARHPAARSQAGLLMFRYNSPIVFFSAPHFKREVLAAAATPSGRIGPRAAT